jgi:tetratricopeptide (TPR) repeat protein
MSENSFEINQIIQVQSKNLVKIGKSLSVSNKLIYNGIDELFNEAFYLMNSKYLKRTNENFLFQIENNRDYIKKNNFKFIAKTDEDFEKAIEYFNKVIELLPNCKHAYLLRGIARTNYNFSTNKFYLLYILHDFLKALNIDPDFSEVYFYRSKASIYLSTNPNYYIIIEDLTKAINIDRNNWQAYSWRGFIKSYQEINDTQGAIDDLTKAIEINPLRGELYKLRGTYRNDVKEFNGAIDDFSKALDLLPKEGLYLMNYKRRAEAKLQTGDLKGAEADFQKFNELK